MNLLEFAFLEKHVMDGRTDRQTDKATYRVAFCKQEVPWKDFTMILKNYEGEGVYFLFWLFYSIFFSSTFNSSPHLLLISCNSLIWAVEELQLTPAPTPAPAPAPRDQKFLSVIGGFQLLPI